MAGLSKLGVTLTTSQTSAFMEDLDVDGSGTISLNEFKVAIAQRAKLELKGGPVGGGGGSIAGGPHGAAAWAKVLGMARTDPAGWTAMLDRSFGPNGQALQLAKPMPGAAPTTNTGEPAPR